jgi:periplasmic protein TonB
VRIGVPPGSDGAQGGSPRAASAASAAAAALLHLALGTALLLLLRPTVESADRRGRATPSAVMARIVPAPLDERTFELRRLTAARTTAQAPAQASETPRQKLPPMPNRAAPERQTADVAPVAVAMSLAAVSAAHPSAPAAALPHLVEEASSWPAAEAAEAASVPPRSASAPSAAHHHLPPEHAACAQAPHPPLLRERGIEGRVQLRVHIGADGRAREVQLLASSGYRLFDEAALAQARGCRFRPALRDDTPIDAWVEFPVRFALAG